MEPATSQRVPLEALLMAFRHSRARQLTGSSALRMVLSGQYRDLVHDGTFHLGPIWELLAGQPNFDPAMVQPALARVKSWEDRMGLKVELPAEMAQLDRAQIEELASSVQVPTDEADFVWNGGVVQTSELELMDPNDPGEAGRMARGQAKDRVKREKPAATAPVEAADSPLSNLSPKKRRMLELGSAAAILLSAGLVFMFLRGGGERTWTAQSMAFAGDIPISAATRSGVEVGGTLKDTKWLGQPLQTREAQMKKALAELPPDVQVFFLRDSTGKVRAAARKFDEGRQVKIYFVK